MELIMTANQEDLSEEVFCLKYELETLGNLLIRGETERWVPGYLLQRTENSHLDRYKLASAYTEGLNVLDIACGTGKGSNLMAINGKANSVSGFDIEKEAIRYAKWRNSHDNINFEVRNAESLECIEKFDFAVSFETIEHLVNYKKFLNNIVISLKDDGLFMVSTPISRLTIDKTPYNPYHVQEWGFIKFQEILLEFFDIEKVYVQLYPKSLNIYQKILRRIKNKIIKHELTPDNNFSKIEEFNGQYSLKELGNKRHGYQIVLAKVKKRV